MSRELVDHDIETDILVVGGGIAGSRASIEANRLGARVLMIVKGVYGSSGCSVSPHVASAIGPWSDPKDSVEQHLKDMVVLGKQFLSDQELTRIQAQEGGERLLELEKWGMLWDRDAEDRIALYPNSKLFPSSHAVADRWISFKRRGTHAVGPFWTGHGTVDILRDQVNRQDIPFIEEAIVCRIFLTDGKVAGALAYDYLNSKITLIRCSAVVVASGDAAQAYFPHTMVSGESTGDGFALAYEAGAQLLNMEQFEYIALHHAYPDSARAKAALESPSESGVMAYLRNSLGERFMERYSPKKELAPQEEVGWAMWNEVKEGRGGPHGGVFLDFRHVPLKVFRRSCPGRLEVIEKLGYDLRKETVEVYPVVHTESGGIRIDGKCQTNVAGLYAAGQVAFAVNDNLGEGATGVTDALVWGKRAGEFAAIYSRTNRPVEPNVNEIAEEAHQVRAPLEATSGISPIKVMRRLQGAMWEGASIVKNEDCLRRTLREIENIREHMLGQMYARIKTGMFNCEIREAIETRHMLTTSEMIVRASLMRKESRNRFQRSDYPKRDDERWLKHIVIQKTPTDMSLWTIPVEFPYVKK